MATAGQNAGPTEKSDETGRSLRRTDAINYKCGT
jgi:hypothetical protein